VHVDRRTLPIAAALGAAAFCAAARMITGEVTVY